MRWLLGLAALSIVVVAVAARLRPPARPQEPGLTTCTTAYVPGDVLGDVTDFRWEAPPWPQ